jgi:hypothetical protein
VLFVPQKDTAIRDQEVAINWLQENLHLQIHPRNNWVFQTHHGLHFLGHNIYPGSGLTVDKVMRSKINRELNMLNIGSYGAMQLPDKCRKQLPWKILTIIK